jgi:hypothetical protein
MAAVSTKVVDTTSADARAGFVDVLMTRMAVKVLAA